MFLWVGKAYRDYALGKMTLSELSRKYGKSSHTIRKYFDRHQPLIASNSIRSSEPINLVFDATFFGRTRGWIIFRAHGQTLYGQKIFTETLDEIELAIRRLEAKNYRFKSFTIDGRRGVIHLLRRLYPSTPIQMCLFHQAQIIRRYTTTRPQTRCGAQLKKLMHLITCLSPKEFHRIFESIRFRFRNFLKERNEMRQFKHRRLRSAIRSLKTNLPYLFTHRIHPHLSIPSTTNTCDGSFAHWKQKLKIHRGLRQHRQDKMFEYLFSINRH